jgi:hypothetical protein
MDNLMEQFISLSDEQKRLVHIELCKNALRVWEKYVSQTDDISYVEGVVGTFQIVDKSLPKEAFEAAIIGKDTANIDWRYAEPINAMQDEDLEFPDNIKFAYYAIYNFFNKYGVKHTIDDWLICNQAISAETVDEWQLDLLDTAIFRSL